MQNPGSRPGIEPLSPALQGRLFNHWATRAILYPSFDFDEESIPASLTAADQTREQEGPEEYQADFLPAVWIRVNYLFAPNLEGLRGNFRSSFV